VRQGLKSRHTRIFVYS